MKRKSTVIGYALVTKVAERLADRGDPDAGDFGLKALGVAVDHLSDAELHKLMHAAFHILDDRRIGGGYLTNRQLRLMQTFRTQITERIWQSI